MITSNVSIPEHLMQHRLVLFLNLNNPSLNPINKMKMKGEVIMYQINNVFLKKLHVLAKANTEGYPDLTTIESYMDGNRKAQENTVRALAALLKVDDWKDLIKSN